MRWRGLLVAFAVLLVSLGASRVPAAYAASTQIDFSNPIVTEVAPGYNVLSIANGDFTGDGKVDVVVAINGSPTALLKVFPGLGDGSFASSIDTNITSSTQVDGLAAGDINGDGNLDVLIGSYAPGDAVRIALGNGSGGFTMSLNSFALTPSPKFLALGDLDNDNDLDLVVRFSTGLMVFYLNDGSGLFTGSVTIGMDNDPRALTLADVNADGNLDVVTSDGNNKTVTIAYGNGAGDLLPAPGGFVQLDLSTLDSDLTTAVGVGAADFNGDGLLEIVVSVNGNHSAPGVYLINPRVTPTTGLYRSWNATPALVTTGDVTGDGIPDAITAWTGDDKLVIWPGLGDGTLATSPYSQVMGVSPATFQPGAYTPMLANIDSTGLTDIIVGGETASFATVLNQLQSSTPSTNAAQFSFFTPDGRECTAISPQLVRAGSQVALPGPNAACSTMPGSTVEGWFIPTPPNSTMFGSESNPFPPGQLVNVVGSQRFTAIMREPILTFLYDANVLLNDTCVSNPITEKTESGRSGHVWVPRGDVSLARFPGMAACTPPGHALTGWNTRGDGSGTTYQPLSPLPADWASASSNYRTLFAMWRPL